MNFYVLESNKDGWRVVVSDMPYCRLHPSNFTVVASKMNRHEAIDLCQRLEKN